MSRMRVPRLAVLSLLGCLMLPGQPPWANGGDGDTPPTPAAESILSWFRRLPFFGQAAPQDDKATVPPRLLPLAQPLWSELSPTQREALAPFAHEWNSWTLTEKKIWLSLADQLPQMREDKRARARQRIDEWARLSPAERKLARDNYRLARQRPANERAQAWKDYDSMTGEQKSVLREAATGGGDPRPSAPPSGLARQGSQPFSRLWPDSPDARSPASRTRGAARPPAHDTSGPASRETPAR